MFHHLDVFYGSETGTAQVRREACSKKEETVGETVNFMIQKAVKERGEERFEVADSSHV